MGKGNLKVDKVPDINDPNAMADLMRPHFHLLKKPEVQEDIRRCMEAGVMRDLGFEDENAQLTMTKGYVVLLHAHPELKPKLNADGTPKPKKPLTSSQKRALARDDIQPLTKLPTRKRPDEETELRPDQYKVVQPGEEPLEIGKPRYVNRAGNPLPDEFEPVGPVVAKVPQKESNIIVS